MQIAGYILLITIVGKCSAVFTVEADQSLKAVAVLFRHGDRSPISSYPNDPYFDKKYWPEGYGQLLKAGKERQYKLGEYLRSRYSNFLSKNYLTSEIFVRSSDIDRTLMSASSNLAAIYANDKDSFFNDNLKWEPIPIHTVPILEDSIICMCRSCPKYKELYQASQSSQYQEFLESYPELYELISNETNWTTDKIDFEVLYTTFYVYKMHNETYLPPWYEFLNKTQFELVAGKAFSRETTTALKRLGTGPFLSYLTSHLDGAINSSASKFLMLSGHDTTVAAALNAMDAFDDSPPEFTSMIIWEVYQQPDGNYTIDVFYKKNSDANSERIKVNNCGSQCSYNKFKEFLKPMLIDDATWLEECKSTGHITTLSLLAMNLIVIINMFVSY